MVRDLIAEEHREVVDLTAPVETRLFIGSGFAVLADVFSSVLNRYLFQP